MAEAEFLDQRQGTAVLVTLASTVGRSSLTGAEEMELSAAVRTAACTYDGGLVTVRNVLDALWPERVTCKAGHFTEWNVIAAAGPDRVNGSPDG